MRAELPLIVSWVISAILGAGVVCTIFRNRLKKGDGSGLLVLCLELDGLVLRLNLRRGLHLSADGKIFDMSRQ